MVGLLAVLVDRQWGPLLDLDRATTRDAESLTGLTGAAGLLTDLGAPHILSLATVVLAVLLLRRGERRLAVFVVLARVGAQLLSTSLKAAVDRARPVFEDPVATAGGSSFPSGHTIAAASFALVVVIVCRPRVGPSQRPWLLAGGAVFALLIAATRVVLGVHYLSDVIAGLVIGAGWTAVVATLLIPTRVPVTADRSRP